MTAVGAGRRPFSRPAYTGLSAVLLLTGCGGKERTEAAETGPVAWQSGSRLRARVVDGGDGAVNLVGWYDRELDANCSFRMAEDGIERCMPEYTGDTLAYADETCSNPILILPQGCPYPAPPKWLSFNVPPTGEACSVTRTAGARVLEASTIARFYRAVNGVCELSGSTISLTVDSVEPVPVDRFVEATSDFGETSGPLASWVRRASDGSSEVTGLFDVERHSQCTRFSTASGERCLGEAAAGILAYSDAACTSPIAPVEECSTPTIAVLDEHGECGAVAWKVRALGDPLTGPVFTSSNGTCSPDSLPASGYSRTGADIEREFPPVEDIQIGSGRLRTVRKGAGGVALGPSESGFSFLDRTTGETCELFKIGNARRCGPRDQAFTTSDFFADAACTEPLAKWAPRHSSCDAPPPTFRMQFLNNNSCSTTAVEYRTVELWTGAVFTRLNGPCGPGTPEPHDVFAVARDLVDPATFPEVAERTE